MRLCRITLATLEKIRMTQVVFVQVKQTNEAMAVKLHASECPLEMTELPLSPTPP